MSLEWGEIRWGLKFVAFNIADTDQLDLDSFDAKCREIDYMLGSTKKTPTSTRHSSFRLEHLTEEGWKITGTSRLKFIVIDSRIYIFPEDMIHKDFLRNLKETQQLTGELKDAGKITLKATIEKGQNGEPQIKETKRYLYDESRSLWIRDVSFRNKSLLPSLRHIFDFSDPGWD